MSQPHKIQVRNRAGAEGKITVGANTEVLLDGKRLGGARFIKIEIDARKVAKVLIELYAEVEVEANAVLETTQVEETPYKTSEGKTLAIHTLSSYSPTKIVKAK